MSVVETFATNAIKYGTRAKFGIMLPSVKSSIPELLIYQATG